MKGKILMSEIHLLNVAGANQGKLKKVNW